MRKVRSVLAGFLHPPKWVTLLVPLVVFAALVYVFVAGQNDSPTAYLIYALSAYCLVIWALPLPGVLRAVRASALRRLNATALGNRYLHDPAFRDGFGMCRGMTVNFLYVAFRVVAGVRHTSVWFLSMAVYYLVLGVLRLSLILSYRRGSEAGEVRCYRRTAWLLFLLNISMGGMVLLMVLTDSGYSYPGYVIYLSAMYAFYAMTASVVNLVKFRGQGNPVLHAAKALNFISAMMSILGLQTAMIARFPENDVGFRTMMNAITGSGVWVAVILTAVHMLRRSRKMKGEVDSRE